MPQKEEITFIPGTPAAMRVYHIRNYRPHWHSKCLEVLFVLKGKARVLASYDRFDMEEGDFVVLNEGDIHFIHSEEENLLLSLFIDLTAFEEIHPYILYLNFICESFNTNAMQEKAIPELRQLLLNVIVEAAGEAPDTEKINQNMKKILDLLVCKFDMVHYYNGRSIPEEQLRRYHQIMKEIETGYSGRISLEELAEKVFIGKNYMSQFWKKMTSMNFTEYLNSRRSEMAEKLLLTTGKSISSIALDCGFSDPKYIYKSFRKWYGVTPSEHKAAYSGYEAREEQFDEYDGAWLLSRFGSDLLETFMDEEKSYLIHSAQLEQNWRKKYDIQMRKFTGSRIKKEMIRSSHQEAGLKELHLPLLDRNVARLRDGAVCFDEDFIETVFQLAREMGYLLCIEIRYEERSGQEWETVVKAFMEQARRRGGREILNRCRFSIFIGEPENDKDARELVKQLERDIDTKKIKLALRFA
ncbi:helix-turn-helix domain-containing protein [bacterium 210820-DFI.6.37]|nr:helix-turn-helix domain-containing protein [bacterium 210820-DFI.6.37]